MDSVGLGLDFLSSIEELSSPDAVLMVFSGLISQFGLENFALGDLANPRQTSVPLVPIFLSTYWPPEWAERWKAKSYVLNDPVVLQSLHKGPSFYWRDIRPHQRGLGARIMDEGAEFGLRDGLCIPVHRAGYVPAAVSIGGMDLHFQPDERRLLEQCAHHVYDKVEKLMRPATALAKPRLSNREREVLHWIAAGKSTTSIADILTLSEHTVRDYVKSAMRKLNATTQAQAIAIAVRIGEILY